MSKNNDELTLIVYYANGNITSVREVGKEKDWFDIAKNYNEKNKDNGISVEVKLYPHNDIVTYLFRRKALEKQDFLDTLCYIESDISDISSKFHWLCEELKRNGEDD
jgi:hypothetical protein